MRISVTGAKSVIGDLKEALAKDGVLGEERADGVADKTGQEFGFLEVAEVVALVVNSAKLIEYLIFIAKRLRNGEKQRLQVKTDAGTATVEVDNTSSAETLAKQLSSLHT